MDLGKYSPITWAIERAFHLLTYLPPQLIMYRALGARSHLDESHQTGRCNIINLILSSSLYRVGRRAIGLDKGPSYDDLQRCATQAVSTPTPGPCPITRHQCARQAGRRRDVATVLTFFSPPPHSIEWDVAR